MHQGAVRVFTNQVDHVIHGDTANHPVVFIHHRGGEQVVVLEQPGYIAALGGDRNAGDIGVQHVGDGAIQVGGDQGAQAQPALIMAFAVDHHEHVGVRRQRFQQAQIAQHGADFDVGTDLDGVGVHQTAGRVLRVGQHRLELLALAGAAGAQQFIAQVTG